MGSCCGPREPAPSLISPFVTAAAAPVPVKKAILICNPVGGNGKGKRLANEIVLPMLEFAGVEVTVLWTEYSGHAEEIGRTAELAGVDALVAMGGDGTLSEVVTGYLQRAKQPACPLGFVPSGTGNTVLHEVLGEPTVGACETGVRAAVAAIIGGRTRRVDAQRLEMTSVDGTSQKTRYSINTVAAGFAAEVNEIAEGRRFLGPMRYSISVKTEALKVPWRAPCPAMLTVDGAPPIRMEDVFIFACHLNKYTGTEHRLCPQAQLDDGLLDLVYTNTPLRSILTVATLDELVKGGGRHVSHPAVSYHRCAPCTLRPTCRRR